MSTDPIAAIEARLRELDEQIAALAAERERLERALGAARGLTLAYGSDNDKSMDQVNDVDGAEISRGRKGIPATQRLRSACNAAGMSIRGLARKLGTNQPRLTQAAQGIIPIPMELAERIQAATRSSEMPEGLAATSSNWPKLQG